jgi:predicted ATPase/DNA-binding CsgD family transcriptional regulator
MSTGVAARAGNLPAELTSFVNRTAELADLGRLIPQSRLVTVTGVAGVGKTRLALRAADRVRRQFPDGVWLVELAQLNDETLLAHTIARVLKVHDPLGDPWRALLDFLEPRRILLVLDNCEHVVGGVAKVVSGMLSATDGVRVLATSREVLRLAGEQELRVQPLLAVGADGVVHGALTEAVELFQQRAALAVPTTEWTEADRAAVAEICRRLDGIPLAIELAAVRTRVLSVQQLRSRVDDRFRVLAGGPRGGIPQQRTLRAAVEWSYDLCDPEEQTVWVRASVFAHGFDLDGIEALYRRLLGDAAVDDVALVDVLDGLASKSVLSVIERDGRPWYHLLETLRAYGTDVLRRSGDEARVRRAFAERYVVLAGRAEQEWFSPRQQEWLATLEREHANLRVALEYLLADGQAEAACLLSGRLWFHWLWSGWLAEGRVWLGRVLAASGTPGPARAVALLAHAFLAGTTGDVSAASRMAAEARDLAERFGDRLTAAAAVSRLAAQANYRGDTATARSLHTDSLSRFAALGGPAETIYGVQAMQGLGSVLLQDGDVAQARELADEVIAACRARGDRVLLSTALVNLARAQWMAGEHTEAVGSAREAIRHCREIPIPPTTVRAVEQLAWIAATTTTGAPGEGGPAGLEEAAVLLGAADRLWRDFGLLRLRATSHFAGPHRDCEERARAGLGEARYAAAFRRGAELELPEIFDRIAPVPGPRAGPPEPPGQAVAEVDPWAPLTRREREVAALVAHGLTNQEIADRLVISRRTAEGHVDRILRKLGLTSRVPLAAQLGSAQSGR